MLVTAILMGFVGSLHCVGMCSPLATAVANLSPRYVRNKIFYNSGRILTYGILGSLVGAFGALAGLGAYQSWLSAGLGAILLLFGILGVTALRVPIFTRVIYQLTSKLRKVFGEILKKGSIGSLFLLGAVNGLLPCGLTYLALAYCITLPNAWQGFLYMIFFGLGTLPAMVGAHFVGRFLSSRLPGSFRHATMVVLILLGSLLIFRSAIYLPVEKSNSAQAAEVICP